MATGADASDKKELLPSDDSFRERKQSRHERSVRLHDGNDLVVDPELVTDDGALGFWKAAGRVMTFVVCGIGGYPVVGGSSVEEPDADLWNGCERPCVTSTESRRAGPYLNEAGAIGHVVRVFRHALPDAAVRVVISVPLVITYLETGLGPRLPTASRTIVCGQNGLWAREPRSRARI